MGVIEGVGVLVVVVAELLLLTDEADILCLSLLLLAINAAEDAANDLDVWMNEVGVFVPFA